MTLDDEGTSGGLVTLQQEIRPGFVGAQIVRQRLDGLDVAWAKIVGAVRLED